MNKRAARITLDWVCGSTFREIAAREGLSAGRCQQIKDSVFSRISEPFWFKDSASHRAGIIAAKIRWLVNPDAEAFDRSTPAGEYFAIIRERNCHDMAQRQEASTN